MLGEFHRSASNPALATSSAADAVFEPLRGQAITVEAPPAVGEKPAPPQVLHRDEVMWGCVDARLLIVPFLLLRRLRQCYA